MTNAIGSGTFNLTINVPRGEHDHLVRLASALHQSLGGMMRRITLKGLEAELAQIEAQLHREVGFISKDGEVLLIRRAEALRQTVRSIRSTREKYYGAVMTVLIVVCLLMLQGD